MARDSQGNNLDDTDITVTGRIILVPYAAENVITPQMIASDVADPELPAAYNPDACVGLITSDGAPQDGREAGDDNEFWQQGYTLSGDPTLTTQFTTAEDNDMTRRVTIGDPDEYGVYHVTDIVQNKKWMAYKENVLRSGKVRRRAGVVQVTNNEPGQETRGSVKGNALTATWQADSLYGNDRYIESTYDPSQHIAVTSITANPASVSVEVGKTATVALAILPAEAANQRITVESSDEAKATATVDGTSLTVTGVATTEDDKPAQVTATVGGKSVVIPVTVSPKA